VKIWQFLADTLVKLKGKKIINLRFRPQHPIDKCIADFYCHPIKLVIEVDGGIHKSTVQKEYDINRAEELKDWGIKAVRFTNHEIERNINLVKSEIERICIDLFSTT
jgi:very-short-patch-repair endonuclease